MTAAFQRRTDLLVIAKRCAAVWTDPNGTVKVVAWDWAPTIQRVYIIIDLLTVYDNVYTTDVMPIHRGAMNMSALLPIIGQLNVTLAGTWQEKDRSVKTTRTTTDLDVYQFISFIEAFTRWTVREGAGQWTAARAQRRRLPSDKAAGGRANHPAVERYFGAFIHSCAWTLRYCW